MQPFERAPRDGTPFHTLSIIRFNPCAKRFEILMRADADKRQWGPVAFPYGEPSCFIAEVPLPYEIPNRNWFAFTVTYTIRRKTRCGRYRGAVARHCGLLLAYRVGDAVRLSTLNPRWVQPDSVRVAVPVFVGVSFDCPHCGKQRLSARFRQPIDPQGLLQGTTWQAPSIAWDRTGEDFETLTLAPSIDFAARGHWHGHITNGEVQTS